MGNIEIFETMATKYDSPERSALSNIFAAEIRKHLQNGKEKTAIDYGCGTGLVGMALLDDCQSILFVDAAKNMIEVVKQKIIQTQAKNATALCLDAESALQEPLQADIIFMVQVLLHVADIRPLLTNLYQSLHPNGDLFIIDFDENNAVNSDKVHPGFKQEQLIQTMEEIGFCNVSAETFYHGKQLFMNQDASLFILKATKAAK